MEPRSQTLASKLLAHMEKTRPLEAPLSTAPSAAALDLLGSTRALPLGGPKTGVSMLSLRVDSGRSSR
ncbi:MAG: hypothetical protein U1E65_04200 [Myxococcota bacterium]